MKRLAVAVAASVLAFARVASATGFTDVGQDIHPYDKLDLRLDGYLRLRGEALYDLDLNRGLTPSGSPLFPVSLSDPSKKTLTYGDTRLRTDTTITAPGGSMDVKARIDLLDNVPLGGSADGVPLSSTRYQQDSRALRIKRVYGEVLTPIGLLAAGRMGQQWGLGMVANGGDCDDCDSGDAADRVAFIVPTLGHIFAVAYDFSATLATTARPDGSRFIDFEPAADVRTATFAFLRYKDERTLARRRAAGRTTLEYGATISHRWQGSDIPATYLTSPGAPPPITAASVTTRGYQATVFDVWGRLTTRLVHVEVEAAYVGGTIEQASLVPGALYRDPVTSRQFGAALESEVAAPRGSVGAGLDLGYASGDDSPGFGAFPGAQIARPGDLDGSKLNPPFHTHVDNFRFNTDYRIDRILFREIIGTVTGAAYARPHARWTMARLGRGGVEAQVAAVGSTAVFAASTPGGKRPLGIEIDPTLGYGNGDGFSIALEYGVLFPLAGLDNVDQRLAAKPAQLARVRLLYRF